VTVIVLFDSAIFSELLVTVSAGTTESRLPSYDVHSIKIRNSDIFSNNNKRIKPSVFFLLKPFVVPKV
jgi:hypothetical protein